MNDAPSTAPAVSGTPETRRAWTARLWPAARSFLTQDARGLRILTASALAVAFVGMIWYWTGGALLYGGDNIGLFHAGDLPQNPHADFLVPTFAAAVFPSNLSAGLYFALGIDAFLSAYAAQFFARTLFRRTFVGNRLYVVGILSAGLYLVSPLTISYWYVGLVTNVFLSTSAFFGVLGMLVKLLKSLSGGRRFSLWDALLLGVLFGLSGPVSIPDEVRSILIGSGLFLGAFVIGLIAYRATPAQAHATYASIVRVLVISAPLAAALLFYPLYEFATSPGFNLHSVGSVANQFNTHLATTTFNPLTATVRLEGRFSFVHTLYYPNFAANPGLVFTTWMWPALALVVPCLAIAIWEFPDRWLLAAVEIVAIPSVIWEAGSNAPFGPVHDAIVSVLPYGNTLLQTYVLTLILLSKLYPVLVAFSIVTLGNLAAQVLSASRRTRSGAPAGLLPTLAPPFDSRAPPPRGWARVGGASVAGILVVVMAVSAWPLYTGQVERTTWAPDQEGFHIPSGYFAVRAAMTGGSAPTVLLLPSINTDVKTTWGFNGANGFFSNFYYPANVIDPRFYGSFSLYVNSTVQNYTIATNPIAPNLSNVTSYSVSWPAAASHESATPSGGLRLSFGPSRNLDFGNSAWVRLAMPYSNATFVDDAIANGVLWIGLQTQGAGTAWYTLGSASNALVESMSNSTLTVDLLLASPSLGAPLVPSKFAGVSVQVREPARTFGVLSAPTLVQGVVGTEISRTWLGMMRGLGVTYLLVDSTFTTGQTEPQALVNDTVAQLAADGYLYPDLTEPGLTLYELATG